MVASGSWRRACLLPLCCLDSVEPKVVLTAPGHQVVNLPPVGGLIPTRDEPNEGGAGLIVLKAKQS